MYNHSSDQFTDQRRVFAPFDGDTRRSSINTSGRHMGYERCDKCFHSWNKTTDCPQTITGQGFYVPGKRKLLYARCQTCVNKYGMSQLEGKHDTDYPVDWPGGGRARNNLYGQPPDLSRPFCYKCESKLLIETVHLGLQNLTETVKQLTETVEKCVSLQTNFQNRMDRIEAWSEEASTEDSVLIGNNKKVKMEQQTDARLQGPSPETMASTGPSRSDDEQPVVYDSENTTTTCTTPTTKTG